ncbi:MAG: leucyl aminopeptidase family protein [Phycisphaerales bacterium]
MFTSISVGGESTSTVIVGRFKGQPLDSATLKRLQKLGAAAAATAACERADATGDAGTFIEAYPAGHVDRVIIAGLGDAKNLTLDAVRTLGGNTGRRLNAARADSALVDLGGPLNAAGLDQRRAGQAFGEGLGLIGWVCDEFRGKATDAPKRTALKVRGDAAKFTLGLETGLGLAVGANLARTLSQTPPNIATTGYMSDQAKALAKQCGLSFKEWEGDALEKERFTGLINVGKASENKPRLVRLEYKPAGKADAKSADKPIVLVGKTMTYDTGGLSLKINNGMVGMKRDKDGGCAVLGAMHAIATVLKPKRRVVALLSIAENSISDEAYRPDDVITYRNGVTVEVTNTDAEGRLVLADALCWACEKESPACVIDIATLTGGVVVALGSTFAGMFCEDDKLRAKVEAASAGTGERVWRLPMHSEYRDLMKSPVADILNSNPNRKAHPIQGAAFLSYFVTEGTPWCHLDIAGVHAAEKNAGCFIEGPTGWGARLMASLAASY